MKEFTTRRPAIKETEFFQLKELIPEIHKCTIKGKMWENMNKY